MDEPLTNDIQNEFITDKEVLEVAENNNLSEPENEAKNYESLHSTDESCLCDHQFSMNIADYQLGAVIGFGSSAIVYMAKYVPLSMDVAIKMIELDHFERNRIDELRKEIQVMAFCKHPNLLGNLTSFVFESKLWIVTPFLAGGSCLDLMKSGFKDGFDESVIATILVQALQGLEYLHENGHIHRDVKCGNLLMAEDGLVQLADFGVSSSLMEDGERQGVRKTYVGTPCWMAPEVMEITRGYDFKADIWSFGITALELAYGHAPYAKFPPMKVIYLTISGKPPTLDKKQTSRKYSRMFKDMIDCCLQRDPGKRPTAKVLLKHPFFKTMAKKPHFLVSNVVAHVPPVNLRDKSAQLRARGLPIPDGVSDGNEGPEFPNRSVLGQIITSAEDEENEITSDSWDFSVDNSVEPDTSAAAPPSAFDVIAEEEEDEVVVVVEEGRGIALEKPTAVSDPLPDARPIEDDEIGFNGLQKNRTSRFILEPEDDISESIGKLDLTSTVVSSDHEGHDDVVGSINEIIVSKSNAGTPPISSSSSESILQQSASSHHARSGSPNDANEPAPTEVKKGRFSVLEAVNVSDVDPIPDDDSEESGSNGSKGATLNSASNNPAFNYHEEEKRSRFEVSLNVPVSEVSDSEDPENSKANINQQIYSTTGLYHNSDPMISGPRYAPPYPQYIQTGGSFYPVPSLGPVYPPRPSLTSSTPFYPPLHSPHPTSTAMPVSPVNPAQLDHLLHVNDYIRNQLVELKYRQDLLNLQQFQHQHQHQHQRQFTPHHLQQFGPPGMRPHSTFNPHSNNYPTDTNLNEIHQLHHSHPVMPPVNSEPPPPPPLVSMDYNVHQGYYCCPPSVHQSNQGSISNSVSPVPADSSSTAAANANFNFILKELENIKKENDEMLKSYLHQQQQQTPPQ